MLDFEPHRTARTTSPAGAVSGPGRAWRPMPQGAGADLAPLREVLGPDPARALACMVELGLSDDEIARYYRCPVERLAPALRVLRAAA
ncbi:hypothetical protein [Tranquillimonas alkanivorans]|uniref:Uncharacterized protein n=1 Tax=Tranquillimonas alkanivorans TaxID=441119 RepID=A0A1I5S325_9RHOB|nr:hypothetical protein [Tranquillimonas alkanivorans]SFP65057.1 hypothetical protein SAMN04488047_11014 [Tranquillimonas alkanivorans]